ncbi:carboxypeptidase-like regulatory domain-containing protein [Flavobacteriaceae bacterium F08102]|nr:carboxypeptidase-like regulatory domain-containing protein [Flavobacteriaceae bacterium F08102]
MSRFKIFFFLLFISTITFSQVKVTGMVKDSIGNPLNLANVIAVNQDSKAIESYNITNAKGVYTLNLAKNTAYKLSVSFIGMKTIQYELTTQEVAINKDFQLEEDAGALDEVAITYKIPLKISGDTLIYDADSFKNSTDKKLEDVLKNMPGFEVTKDGDIKFEGKKITTITVEGKRFFDGSSKLASKNIPAGVLDKIEVLKNHDNISQLSGVRDNSENIAINIKLKEGKKNFWFGDLMAGGGPDERYILHPKLFYYSPKKSINVITDFNNIGEAPLSASDLSRFSGRLHRIHQNSGTQFNVESPNTESLSLRNNRAKGIDTKFAAANLNVAPTGIWDLSGFAIYSGSRVNTQENSFRQFFQSENTPNPPDDESITNRAHQKSDMGIFKISSTYKPNSNNQLDYNGFARISKTSLDKSYFSSVLQDINEKNTQDPYKITQGLDYYYTLNERNVFAFESQYLLQREDPFYNAILTQQSMFSFADNLGLDQNQGSYNINQDQLVKTNKFDATLNYWYVINRKSNLNFTLGTLLSAQQFNSSIYQILDNGSVYELNPPQGDLNNDISYHFNDVYLGLHYRIKMGVFTIAPGISVHSYLSKNKQFNATSQFDFIRVLPDFNMNIQLKSTETIRFDYRIKTQFTNVNQLAEGLVLNNYNALYLGNRDLENTLAHTLSLSYTNQINLLNRYRNTTINASVNYLKTTEAIRNSIDPEGILQVATPFNSNFEDEGLTGNLQLTRAIWKLRAVVGGVFSYSKYDQIYENIVSTNESFIQSYNFGLKTNFYREKFPNIEVGYNHSINTYNQGLSNPKYITDSPYANIEAAFLKGFIFKADYAYTNYKNESTSLNTYSFLNASLSYQHLKSQWEYSLTASNLLNTRSLNTNMSNDFFVSTNQYFIQPRVITIGIKYNL